MQHVTRAGQYAANPPTGQRVIPYIMGGGALALYQHPNLIAPALGLMGVARELLTPKLGQRFLIRAARAHGSESIWRE